MKEKYRLVKQHDRVGLHGRYPGVHQLRVSADRISPELWPSQGGGPLRSTITADKLVINTSIPSAR